MLLLSGSEDRCNGGVVTIDPENPTRNQARRLLEIMNTPREKHLSMIRNNFDKYLENAIAACDKDFTGNCPACGSDLVSHMAATNLYMPFSCASCECVFKTYPFNHEKAGKIYIMRWLGTHRNKSGEICGISVHDGNKYETRLIYD